MCLRRVLIRATSRLLGSIIDWLVILLFHGLERQALENKAAAEGVVELVHCEVFRNDPEVILVAPEWSRVEPRWRSVLALK